MDGEAEVAAALALDSIIRQRIRDCLIDLGGHGRIGCGLGVRSMKNAARQNDRHGVPLCRPVEGERGVACPLRRPPEGRSSGKNNPFSL